MLSQISVDVTDELVNQIKFYNRFYGDIEKVHLNRSTDGWVDGILFEHKQNAKSFGLNSALSQALIYLSRFNRDGIPIPKKIMIVSHSEQKVYIYDALDYIDIIEDVSSYSTLVPNKGIEGFKTDKEPLIVTFDISKDSVSDVNKQLRSILSEPAEYVKVHIDIHNVYGWANYYYSMAKDYKQKAEKVAFFDELKEPKGTLKHFIHSWKGQESDFALIMDLLNDPKTQKKLGAFYTPVQYCDKAAELVREAIKRVPEGNDYVIIDRCAGTGNLELSLSDEELSHVIINTYELKEWVALKDRLGKLVRYIVPPIPDDKNKLPDLNDEGFLSGANALSNEFINNPEIKQYIDNSKCTIIMYENPPYRDASASDKEDGDCTELTDVFLDMREHLDDFNVSNISTARELVNQFIYSAFKYYLRQPTDSYILLAPVKTWKSIGLLNKHCEKAYLFNREHFHATPASISCCLWYNIPDYKDSITFEALDIDENDKLIKVDDVVVKKCYNTLEPFFDRRSFFEDVVTDVHCECNGVQTSGRKCDGVSYYNDNILAYCRTINFQIAGMNKYFTRQIHYGARGFYIRSDNFLTKLPLFVAKCYPADEWYEKDLYCTTSDGGLKFEEDLEFLKRCLIYTCLTAENKCRSFVGSDGRYYRNELCFDDSNGDTLALSELKKLTKDFLLKDIEVDLLDDWNNLLAEARKCSELNKEGLGKYNSDLTYGLYQIVEEIDVKANPVINPRTGKESRDLLYGDLDKQIRVFKKNLKDYYKKYITPKMFEYELIK